MALPSLDNVPVAYFAEDDEKKTMMVPDVVQIWLTNLVDTLNEALLEIDKRLTAGGL